MKIIFSLLTFVILSTSAYCLDVEDIISLSKANVGDDIILSVLAVSDEQMQISTDDIIRLKKEGVSDKVIKTLVNKVKKIEKKSKSSEVSTKNVADELHIQKDEPKKNTEQIVEDVKEEEEELKPFDQFFLSTYYSHQYGFPEKDYESPGDILGQGLYYNSGYKNYPNSRRVRVYGNSYSHDRFGFQSSPFSIIVPKHRKNYSYNRYNNHRNYNYNRHHKYNKHNRYNYRYKNYYNGCSKK